MLSYKHEFHAGNHADVIKHLVWVGIIDILKKKSKPYSLVDTHAAAGVYDLDSANTAKNKEYVTGISKLVEVSQASREANTLVHNYLSIATDFFNSNQYPGSPFISLAHSRAGDYVHLTELHPNEFNKLRENTQSFEQSKQIEVHLQQRNGLEALVALSPPKPNRGAVLIDPPYELLNEYQDVTDAVSQTLKRWRNATIAIWYPLLSQRAGKKSGASESMVDALSQLASTALNITLTVEDKAADTGMYGSGMCILNPPWQLDQNVESALAVIKPVLGNEALTSVTWLKTENE